MRWAVVLTMLLTLSALRAEGDQLSACEVLIRGTAKGGSIAIGRAGAPEKSLLKVETFAGETPVQIAQKFVAASKEHPFFSDNLTVLDGSLFARNASPGIIFVKVDDPGLVRVENVNGLKAVARDNKSVTLSWKRPAAVEGQPALFRVHIVRGTRSVGSVAAETTSFVDENASNGAVYRILCQYKWKDDADFYSDLLVVTVTNP